MTEGPAPLATRPRGRRLLVRFFAAFCGLLLTLLLALGWLVLTESGARSAIELARRASGMELLADGVSGRLVGPLAIERLRVASPDLRLDVEAIALDWRPWALLQGRLEVDRLSVARLMIATRPSDAAVSAPGTPPDLLLPVTISAPDVSIGQIVLQPWTSAPDVADLVFSRFSVRLSAQQAVQRVDALSLGTPWGELALQAEIDAAANDPLTARGTFRGLVETHAVEVAWRLVGDLELLRVQADASGAGLAGAAEVRLAPFAAMPLLALKGSLGELDPAAFAAGAPSAALNIEADLVGDAGTGGLSGSMQVSNARPASLDVGGLPFVAVAAHVELTPQRVEMSALEVSLPGEGRLSGSGWFEPGEGDVVGRMAITGHLSGVDPSLLHGAAPQGRLGLQLDLDGATDGNLVAEWRFDDSRLAGLAMRGNGRVAMQGRRIADVDAITSLGANRISARGSWGGAGDGLDVSIRADGLEALGYGLGGRARLDARIEGGMDAPSGRIEAHADNLKLPGGLQLSLLRAEGVLGAGKAGQMDLDLAVEGVAAGGGDVQVERGTIRIEGRRDAHRIDVEVSTPQEDRVQAGFRGGLVQSAGDATAVGWKGRIEALELTGRFPLRLSAPAMLAADAQRVVLGEARFEAAERGRILLQETIWTPGRTTLRGELTGLEVAEADIGRVRPRGNPLQLGAEWDIELTQRANGSVRVFREGGDLSVPGELDARLGLQQLELVTALRDNRIALSIDVRGNELGTLTGSITAQAERDETAGWRLAPRSDLLGSVRLDMPSIAWMSRLLQSETVLEGALGAEFSFSGTPAAPVATGRIRGSDLGAVLIEQGVQLSGGDLLAEFDRDRLRLVRLEFVTPNRVRPADARVPVDALVAEPGRLSASGEIALESGAGSFRFSADRMPVLQRPDRWLLLSGEGRASSTWTTLDLDAQLRADAGYVEFGETPPPTLSDDVVIVGREAPAAGGGLKLRAEVSVALGDALYLSALGLDTRLAGELMLRLRPDTSLSATGTIETVGGSYRGYGQSLTIERGRINFQGALDNPGLNVVALRKGLSVEAGIAVTGSARRPQVRLVSSPEVPDPEKLSWIVLGRAPTAGGGADMGLLLPAAQALLGGPGGGMTEQLSRSLGVDELGIGQADSGNTPARTSSVVGTRATGGDGSVGGQVLTIGKRLSPDLAVAFEQSLGGAESLVKLTYQLTRNIAFIARGGSDNAADVFYTISFR